MSWIIEKRNQSSMEYEEGIISWKFSSLGKLCLEEDFFFCLVGADDSEEELVVPDTPDLDVAVL